MLEEIIKKIFPDPAEKKVKFFIKEIYKIKNFEETQKNFSFKDIKNKTQEFKKLFQGLDFLNTDDEKKIKQILQDIKYESFALVKTACKLLYGKKFKLKDGKEFEWSIIPYDVQLVGGLAIHDGSIAEMKTGEGKTLAATMPAYLNSLTGNSVHIVTVNDYLALRDSMEMGILYDVLGLSTGVVLNGQDKDEKKQEYKKDIVYATNNELGFDYLKDNMVLDLNQKVQSKLFFAIIDEVDSILIDEARTPLVISSANKEATTKYSYFANLIKHLKEKIDYKIDEKEKTASLTQEGIKKIEKLLGIENIYVSAHYNDIHHIENALKAIGVFKKDKDYLVGDNGEVLIIDEHTGRVLPGRRYSDGLHQALEAKENVEIQQESITLASITFQNYFRMYWKLSGMTGTAKTESEEFYKVYALDTLVIPTNKPIVREDRKDLLFKNEKGKFDYVVKLIKDLNKSARPILIGTISVEKSEYLSSRLKKESISHSVLNAKYHKQEAQIISQAGQKGAITIATNMAGRGTDIKLGEGVKELGGLVILGTEKHETRRIDNQLRGRSGRQGDPGMTQFLISPNDDIMRIFGGDKLFGVFNSPVFASLPDEEPLIESKMLSSRVLGVQKQVEGRNFDIRKHLLEYDDVMNQHRKIIYIKRYKILSMDDISEEIQKIIESELSRIVEMYFQKGDDNKNLANRVNIFLDTDLVNSSDLNKFSDSKQVLEYLYNLCVNKLSEIRNNFSCPEEYTKLEKKIYLQSLDELWISHIDSMSKLRENVAFEGYSGKNPLIVYKEKAFNKFENFIREFNSKLIKSIFYIKDLSQLDNIDFLDQDMDLESFFKKSNLDKNPIFLLNNEENNTKIKKIRI